NTPKRSTTKNPRHGFRRPKSLRSRSPRRRGAFPFHARLDPATPIGGSRLKGPLSGMAAPDHCAAQACIAETNEHRVELWVNIRRLLLSPVLALQVGRVSVYRLSAHILSGFTDIAGDHVFPEYGGCFHTIPYSVPEAARGVRVRLQYIARSLGCRQLRPGILVGFSDRTAQLDARLPAIDDPGCYETAVLTPESVEAARRMTTRAFGPDAALAQLPALEGRKNALSANGSAPGSGRVGLSFSTFFDLYFDVARD